MTDVDADDVLEALRDQLTETGTPVANAPAVADRLPIGRRRTLDYLEILDARGDVESVPVGPGTAWYIPEIVTVHPEFPPAEPAAEPSTEPAAEPPADISPSSEPSAEPSTEPAAEGTGARHPRLDRDAIVDDLDLPGRDAVLDRRRDAVRAVLEYLDEHGETTAGELRDALYDEHPAGYKHATSWWSNFMQVTLSELREKDVVELSNPSRGRWKTL